MEYTFIPSIILLAVFFIIIKLIRLEGRIKDMKYTLDQISNQMELPENPINEDLRKLLKENKDVEAVKMARENLGLSLVGAKKYVDDLKFADK